MSTDGSGGGGTGGVGVGPCGACKFLRKKCVKGCIFAPYFDSDQGTVHFAAVHRVFGASNASKLLLRIPPNTRLDAVITLCYEALARVRDPVYGCVGHIFTLQQQWKKKRMRIIHNIRFIRGLYKVVNLHTELAYTQARISTLQRPPLPPPQLYSPSLLSTACISTVLFDEETSREMVTFDDSIHQEVSEDGDLQSLAREYVSRYFPGVKFMPQASSA
ncbi:hypothetical protein OROGR_031973 [Orobanche gracilis]